MSAIIKKMYFILQKLSPSNSKKYQIYEVYDDGTRSKIIKFGAQGYEDYTIHKDIERKNRYIVRHHAREGWSKANAHTPGFWSRWLLWNEPTLSRSIQDLKDRMGICIHVERGYAY